MSTWITCSDKVVDTFIIIRQSTIHNTPLLSEFVWISSQASSINSSLWGKTDRQVDMPFRCHYPARSPSTWNNTDMIHHSLFLFILCRLLRHHLNSILRKRTCIYKHLPPLFHGGRSTNITTIQHILSTIFRTFANLIHSIQKSTVNPTPLVRISLPNFSQISWFPTYFRPYHLPRLRPIKPPPQTTNRLPLVLPHLNPKDARPTLPSPYPYFRPTPPPYFIAPPTKSWAFNSITVPPIPLFN